MNILKQLRISNGNECSAERFVERFRVQRVMLVIQVTAVEMMSQKSLSTFLTQPVIWSWEVFH